MKTCLQLASSFECNKQVREDHFDQMLNMIRESNIGKVFYNNQFYIVIFYTNKLGTNFLIIKSQI